MPLPPPGNKAPQKNTFGGFQTLAVYSGAAAPSLAAAPGAFQVATSGDLFLVSGPGRLDSVLLHGGLASGTPTVFYDAAVPTNVAGQGPLVTSGHKPVAVIPGPSAGSGFGAFVNPVTVGMPFFSGLCVANKSGQPGFTLAWTPEVGQ